MKRNAIILALTLMGLSLFSAPRLREGVDPKIQARFEKSFGRDRQVDWKFRDEIWIATFLEAGQQKQVFFSDDGELFGFGKSIHTDLLPSMVTQSIQDRYPGATIQAAYEFKSIDAPTRYIVNVGRLHHILTLSVNEFGDVVLKQKTRI